MSPALKKIEITSLNKILFFDQFPVLLNKISGYFSNLAHILHMLQHQDRGVGNPLLTLLCLFAYLIPFLHEPNNQNHSRILSLFPIRF